MGRTTFGLRRDQLLRLLRIGATQGPAESTDARRSALHQVLSQGLPADLAYTLAGRTLRQVILDPDVDASVLERVKEAYKERLALASSPCDRDVATVLYYAAIASGLIHHNKRLSSYWPQELAQAFLMLMDKAWIDEELRRHLRRAYDLCREAADNGGA